MSQNRALAFVFVTVLIDAIGFGIVIPVMPGLIVSLTGKSLGQAAEVSGWIMFLYASTQFICGPIIGGLSAVTRDVIPHGLVEGPRATLAGLNRVGLKRRGADRVEIQAVRAAYQVLKDGDAPFQERARQLQETTESPLVREIVDFVMGQSDRQFLTPV
jgi:acyl-[acyl carrier protein]--UDP-N-acetylglucosamine O-acyltransferase